MDRTCKINRRTIVQYLLCYILILTTGAVLWTYVLDFIPIKAIIVLLINILIIVKYKIRVPAVYMIYCMVVMSSLMILTYITDGGFFNGDDFNSTLAMLIYALTGFIIFEIDKSNSSLAFIKTVSFFATISLFFFGIQFVFGSNAFPEFIFRDVNYRSEYGFILYTICKQNMRNYGIFYEPGVYQTVLSAALYLLLFNSNSNIKEKSRKRYLIVLTIAMLTTGSTTGYISLAVLFAFYLLGGSGSKKMKSLFLVMLFVAGLALDYFLNGTESLIFTIVLGKFAQIEYNNGYYLYASSGGARLFIIDIALQVLRSKPLTGIGSNTFFINYLSGTYWERNGTGNILCVTIAKRGIIFTVYTIAFFLRKAFQNRKDIYSFFAFVLVFFNTIFAQSQLVYGVFAFCCFVMCGSIQTGPSRIELKKTL